MQDLEDREWVGFLQWALPQLHRPWRGFRKVHRQLRRGVARRLRTLSVPDVVAYRRYLETHPAEWRALDELCPVTISCFYRDPPMWAALTTEVLPALARRCLSSGVVRAASIGCASGEEPYTLALAWQLALAPEFPTLKLEVIATDVLEVMLERARVGCYRGGTVKLLPGAWLEQGFERVGELHCLRPRFREGVTFLRQDLREGLPERQFALLFCRNLAFTYFDDATQRQLLARLCAHLEPGGALVIGKREQLPEGAAGLTPWVAPMIFRHLSGVASRADARPGPAAE
jgi:chemotaxis protein methyltransferase CheR